MNIKPQVGRRNYAKGGPVKGYLMGGVIDEQGVSHGASEYYKPAEVPTGEGVLGELGHTQFVGDQRFVPRQPKEEKDMNNRYKAESDAQELLGKFGKPVGRNYG